MSYQSHAYSHIYTESFRSSNSIESMKAFSLTLLRIFQCLANCSLSSSARWHTLHYSRCSCIDQLAASHHAIPKELLTVRPFILLRSTGSSFFQKERTQINKAHSQTSCCMKKMCCLLKNRTDVGKLFMCDPSSQNPVTVENKFHKVCPHEHICVSGTCISLQNKTPKWSPPPNQIGLR